MCCSRARRVEPLGTHVCPRALHSGTFRQSARLSSGNVQVKELPPKPGF